MHILKQMFQVCRRKLQNLILMEGTTHRLCLMKIQGPFVHKYGYMTDRRQIKTETKRGVSSPKNNILKIKNKSHNFNESIKCGSIVNQVNPFAGVFKK